MDAVCYKNVRGFISGKLLRQGLYFIIYTAIAVFYIP